MLILDNGVAALVRPRLDPGEQLLWCGRPRGGLALGRRDLLLVPFSLLWGGFAIFWEYTVVTEGAPLPFILFGLIFVGIGLYMIVGRFFYDAWRRGRTAYALTDRRVIILSPGREQSLALDALQELEIEESAGGLGSIRLGPRFGTWRRPNPRWSGLPVGPTLERIDNAREVYALIRRRSEALAAGNR